MKNLTRRDFLKGMMVGGVAAGSAGLLAACSSSSSSTSTSSSSESSSSSTDTSSSSTESEETVSTNTGTNNLNLPELDGGVLSLTVNIADFNQSSEGTYIQELWQQKMEEYLGVTLDITWNRTLWADFRTLETTTLQSGDVADISTYSQGKTTIMEYGDDGIVLNLVDYEDYMPYYKEYIQGTTGGEAYAYNADGTAYYFMNGFYNPNDITGSQSFCSFAYRFDVLQAHDLQPATTVDEFTQLCADLQALIDSGEVDADYVIMNSTKDYQFYRGWVGIYHTSETLYWNGSEWKYGPIEDQFREMLKYLNTLYKAGYIDPEFATADYDSCTTKATTGKALVCTTLWAGSASSWNTGSLVDGLEWGLAYLPENTDYGTAWKWGSKQIGNSLDDTYGIYISADTEHPEYCVAMIDYQYCDDIVTLLNWGVEGETYYIDDDGNKTFIDEIMNDDSPATKSAEYGLMASSVCRSGIPFVALDFEAMVAVSSIPEPWWNEEDGYYEGKYWLESSNNGGPDSVSPADRAPVLQMTTEQSEIREGFSPGSYVKEQVNLFITGELDVNDDAAWESYVAGVKTQSEYDFDYVLEMLNECSVTS